MIVVYQSILITALELLTFPLKRWRPGDVSDVITLTREAVPARKAPFMKARALCCDTLTYMNGVM